MEYIKLVKIILEISRTLQSAMLVTTRQTVARFIGQCPASSQIREDYFQTYHSIANDVFNKQSLTSIVVPDTEGKYQSGIT